MGFPERKVDVGSIPVRANFPIIRTHETNCDVWFGQTIQDKNCNRLLKEKCVQAAKIKLKIEKLLSGGAA